MELIWTDSDLKTSIDNMLIDRGLHCIKFCSSIAMVELKRLS